MQTSQKINDEAKANIQYKSVDNEIANSMKPKTIFSGKNNMSSYDFDHSSKMWKNKKNFESTEPNDVICDNTDNASPRRIPQEDGAAGDVNDSDRKMYSIFIDEDNNRCVFC